MARRPLDEECRRPGEAQGGRAPRRPPRMRKSTSPRATTRSHESDGTDADLVPTSPTELTPTSRCWGGRSSRHSHTLTTLAVRCLRERRARRRAATHATGLSDSLRTGLSAAVRHHAV
jgi:hypothetical protein